MALYKVTLAYDGTDFLGFQRQGSGRTVQSEIERALRLLNWQGRAIFSAGRTDTGVHAECQVISFDFDWNHSPEALGKALNANLPHDVAVRWVSLAEDGFHPRYSACWRKYCYRLYSQPERYPLMDRYALRVWPGANLDLLSEAARILIGCHDFSAFGKSPHIGGNTIREVFEAKWEEADGIVRFIVKANAFLYHMVRRMVYLQLQVGQERLSLEDFAGAVNQSKKQAPGLTPPQGLVLLEVGYNKKV
jgi:tRNA pseudouridine38-40 synthase